MLIASAIGAYVGWQTHGIGGAIGLGMAGLIVGGLLSNPSILLQLFT